jgi:hypothetical protein
MDSAHFASKTRQAVETGKAARLDQALACAIKLRNEPAGFDPRVLAHFGAAEMKAFRQTLGLPPPPISNRARPPKAPTSIKADDRDCGWSNQRRPEKSMVLSALGAGLASGALILSLCSVGLLLSSFPFI